MLELQVLLFYQKVPEGCSYFMQQVARQRESSFIFYNCELKKACPYGFPAEQTRMVIVIIY